MIPVRDIMVKPILVERSTSVVETARKMVEGHLESAVVTDAGSPVGIITYEDIIARLVLKKGNIEKTKAEEIMTKHVITIGPNVSVAVASEMMKEHRVRRLVVVEEGKVAGVVGAASIMRHFTDLMNETVTSLLRSLGMGSLLG